MTDRFRVGELRVSAGALSAVAGVEAVTAEG